MGLIKNHGAAKAAPFLFAASLLWTKKNYGDIIFAGDDIMNVVITGASSGIGRACAEKFAENGCTVYSLSRRECDIKGVTSIKCDITDSQQIKSAISQIDKIDILINNAGFGISGAVEFTDTAEMKAQFELNFFAQIEVTKAALPKLKESRGKILFISSAASVFFIPFQAFYSASKSAVESVAFAMRNELKMFGVSVGCVRLGDIKTGFTGAREKSFKGDDVYNGLISRSVSVMENDETNGMDPKDIAAVIFKICAHKKLPPVSVAGLQYKFLCSLQKILPASAVNELVGKLYMKKR